MRSPTLLLAVVAATAMSCFSSNVAAQVQDGDDFGVSLLALTPNVIDDPDQALIDTVVLFGTSIQTTTSLGTPVTISSGQSNVGPNYVTFIEIVTDEPSLLPEGTTFTNSDGDITEPADFLVFAAGTDLANGILDGLDLAAPIVPGSLGVAVIFTVDGVMSDPFPGGTSDPFNDNPYATYQTSNGGPEIDAEVFPFTDDGDISDELLNGLRLEISYTVVPEPASLAAVATGGLLLLRRRR